MQEFFSGAILKTALRGAEQCVEAHIDELNILNVFPVPDGDTGINMFLTLQAANKAWGGVDTESAAAVSAAAARGALLGACGNSGVILSQILRGIAKGMEMKERFSCANFADALQVAAEMARRSVVNPVEGTILTVSREVSEIAAKMAKRGASLKQMMNSVVAQARRTVNRTPYLLPQLKEAGVVDAGAKGLLYVFQGMRNHMWSHGILEKEGKESEISPQLLTGIKSYGYDVQFLIKGDDLSLADIREKIETMGESVLVVGDEQLIRVHIHTLEPEMVFNYARTAGEITNMITENLDRQVSEFRAKHNK
jgi:DAK2 domain fusion protein YloV